MYVQRAAERELLRSGSAQADNAPQAASRFRRDWAPIRIPGEPAEHLWLLIHRSRRAGLRRSPGGAERGRILLAGPGVPDRVRTYMLTFAIADDLAGIVVIALVYSGHINTASQGRVSDAPPYSSSCRNRRQRGRLDRSRPHASRFAGNGKPASLGAVSDRTAPGPVRADLLFVFVPD